jgi:hypothetical protein
MSETEEDATAWLERAATQAQDTIQEIYTEARDAIYAEESGEQPAEAGAGQAEVHWPESGHDRSAGS